MTMRWIGLAALGLYAAAPAHAQTAPGPDDAVLEQAIKLASSGSWEKAIPLFDQFIGVYDRILAENKGVPFCARDEAEVRRFVDYVHADTSNGVILAGRELCIAVYFKGRGLLAMRRPGEAVPLLERAAAMAPMDGFYLTTLAEAYLDIGAWQKSYDTQVKALVIAEAASDPEMRRVTQCEAWVGMAQALVPQARYDEAVAMLNKCLAISPDHEEARRGLDLIAKHRGS